MGRVVQGHRRSVEIARSEEPYQAVPQIFPLNPDQWSNRLRVTVYPGGLVQGELFGTLNGIHQSIATFTDPNGDLYMTFPFTVDGM